MAKTYVTTSGTTYAWGTLNVLFGTGSQNGNTFITDEFEVTEPTWTADRNDNVGNPAGWLGGVERVTGRATLQVANANVWAPHRYDEFTVSYRTGQSNVFALVQVGIPKKQREFDTVPIEFKEKT